MATEQPKSARPLVRNHAPTTGAKPNLPLGSLTAGALGSVGFAVAILQGLATGNGLPGIMARAIVTMFVLAAVGGLVGVVAGRVIGEVLHRRQRELAEALAAAAAEAAARRAADDADSEDAATPDVRNKG